MSDSLRLHDHIHSLTSGRSREREVVLAEVILMLAMKYRTASDDIMSQHQDNLIQDIIKDIEDMKNKP